MNKKDCMNLWILSLIGLIMIFLIFGANYIYGSKTDWFSQHWTFAEYFRNLFYQTGDIFPNFAFNIGAGQNIYNFSYYGLLNPIILSSYFFPFVKMIDYIMLVSILSIFISTFLFYKWLRNNNFSTKATMLASTLFLLASPLIFHSHRHIMFVSHIPFLILGLMGIDKYFKTKQRWLYILSVFLMIMTSYYYSVGGLLVMVIYGVYQYLKLNDKVTIKSFFMDGFKFLIPIFIGILLSGVLLLPTIGVILSGRVDIETSITLKELLIPKIDLDVLLYSAYSLGLTAISIIALTNNFTNKRKEEIFLSIVLVITFFVPIIMYLLNGTLYIRAKVLIPFLPLMGLMIGIFFENIFNNKVKIKLLLFILLVTNIIVFLTGYRSGIYYIDLLVSIIVLLIYYWKKNYYILYIPLLIIAFLTSLQANLDDELVSKDEYHKVFDVKRESLILDTINEDHSFYRFNNLLDTLPTINKIYSLNYYQTSLYSSTYNNDYKEFFVNTYSNAISYRNRLITAQSNNILFETLMGIKYILANDNVPIGYTLIKEEDRFGIYQNRNVFPLGYAIDNVMSYEEFNKLQYPYKLDVLLNNVIVEGTSKKEVLSSIKPIDLDYTMIIGDNLEIKKEENKYIVNAQKTDTISLKLSEKISDKILFVKFDVLKSPSCNKGDLSIDINGISNKLTCRSWMYHNQNYTFEYTISSPLDIDQLNIKFSKGEFEITNIETFIMDYNDVIKATKKIDKMIVDIDKTKGDIIKGSISTDKDGYLVLTIPYDKGFKIKLNGEKQEYERVNNGFIGIPITKGHYEIEIKYQAPLFKEGVISSVIGLMGFILICLLDFRKSKIKIEKIK